jgi:hypothetical protein
LPSPFRGSQPLVRGLKEGPVLSHQYLVEVGTSHISPSGFLVKDLEEFLERHKTVTIGHQAEFVRAVSQNIDDKATEFVGLELLTPFCQSNLPGTEKRTFPGGTARIHGQKGSSREPY